MRQTEEVKFLKLKRSLLQTFQIEAAPTIFVSQRNSIQNDLRIPTNLSPIVNSNFGAKIEKPATINRVSSAGEETRARNLSHCIRRKEKWNGRGEGVCRERGVKLNERAHAKVSRSVGQWWQEAFRASS